MYFCKATEGRLRGGGGCVLSVVGRRDRILHKGVLHGSFLVAFAKICSWAMVQAASPAYLHALKRGLCQKIGSRAKKVWNSPANLSQLQGDPWGYSVFKLKNFMYFSLCMFQYTCDRLNIHITNCTQKITRMGKELNHLHPWPCQPS
jgi:hypothetical protein